jgi:hypothetical protein
MHIAAAIRYKTISRIVMGLEVPKRRIAVTGYRYWSSRSRVFAALERQLQEGEFLLGAGDATGADVFAREWGLHNLAWPVTEFHAPWTVRRKAAGPIRNHFMIDMFRPQRVLAFLHPLSRGTVDCYEYAESLGIEVLKFHEGEEHGTSTQ